MLTAELEERRRAEAHGVRLARLPPAIKTLAAEGAVVRIMLPVLAAPNTGSPAPAPPA